MQVLLVTIGTIGDVMPFLAVAERLRARGHRCIIASNAGYAQLIQGSGFPFAAIWDRSQQSLDHAIAQDPLRAWTKVRDEMFVPATAPVRDFIAQHVQNGPCTVLASWSAFGARLAHDGLGIPLCTVYLSPWAVGVDDGFRADGRRYRNIGLFPAWFGAAAGVLPAGFAMHDDALIPALPEELESFLAQGAPPAIFTPGSFMRGGARFFRESLAACAELDLRAIFLTPYREQVPPNLPTTVRHFPYIALQRLAPRCAALVHHGGIGTCAQGLRAGIPQLVTPLFFDQPDNAGLLARLGVAESLSPSAYCAGQIAAKLRGLLASESVKRASAHVSALFGDQNGVGEVCGIVEALT